MNTRIWSILLIGFASGLNLPAFAQPQYSLRFFGNGVDDIDRVKIRIDDPTNNLPGPPADIGATDFTIEFWVRGYLAENGSPTVTCGANEDWILGNIVFDRDRFSQGRKFGISIANGRVVFGVTNGSLQARTICGATNVLDGQWHHIAVQRRRSDGWMWLYVDGQLQGQADGPDGDISYPDNGVPCSYCCNGGPCDFSDPFIVLGAEKHDYDRNTYPSFSGWLDEVRLSTNLRYNANFTPPSSPFTPDAQTAALYHLDEGSGDDVLDSSGASGGPSHGVRRFGGNPAGPLWSVQSPFRRSGDVDGDGCVDDADLLQVLFAFGANGTDLETDVSNDGIVDDADLLIVLFNFGSGC